MSDTTPAPAPVAQQTTTTTTSRARAPFPTIGVPNFHNIASALETLAFIVAAVLYVLGHGSDQSNAVATALFGAVFHAYNH